MASLVLTDGSQLTSDSQHLETAGALNCSDCKSRFHSAASLLQHFAQHISSENKHAKFGHSLNKISSQEQWGELSSHVQKKKKTKNTGILEKVLRDSVPVGPSHHESSSIDVCIVREQCSSSLSSSSDSLQESKTNISSSSNITCDLKPPNRNNDNMEVFMKDQNSSKVSFLGDNSLVKCDLQKRLENCIRKLTSKQSSNLEIHSSTEKQQYANSAIVQEDVDNLNPLKLGTATKGESDTFLKTSSSRSVNFKISNRKSMGASSRKQQSPKKIFYSTVQNLSKSNEEDISEFTEINNSTCVKASSSPLGERPFKCGQCQATFTRNFLLQKHETKFHPDGIDLVPPSCEIQEVVSEPELDCNGTVMIPPTPFGLGSCQAQLGSSQTSYVWREIGGDLRGTGALEIPLACGQE
uniref:(California timema) hypothetical protein n=1 Tax=Timema californicum TaxID=61474 RepID=A0A7R9IWR7_TIMCA|nr:unnamed protein product [Timema californicum]